MASPAAWRVPGTRGLSLLHDAGVRGEKRSQSHSASPHPGLCPLLATVDPEEYGLSKDLLLLNCIKDLPKNTQILSIHFGEFAH